MIDDKSTTKNVSTKTQEPEITDIQLNFVERRKFRINGDQSKILELDVSDLNTLSRLTEAYPKLKALAEDAVKQVEAIDEMSDDEESFIKFSKILPDIDNKMREQIDYIFNSNASEVCAPKGNMYDPVGGKLRWEHIIETLAGLYTTGLTAEFNKLKVKVDKKTSKYTKKYHN